jgi:hypothetical protein
LEFKLEAAFRRLFFAVGCSRDVSCWQILLQKSFWGVERKISEPLMRFTRGDVGDHIVLPKIDHGPT